MQSLDSCVVHSFCIKMNFKNHLTWRKRSTLWLIWVRHVYSCMEIFSETFAVFMDSTAVIDLA